MASKSYPLTDPILLQMALDALWLRAHQKVADTCGCSPNIVRVLSEFEDHIMKLFWNRLYETTDLCSSDRLQLAIRQDVPTIIKECKTATPEFAPGKRFDPN